MTKFVFDSTPDILNSLNLETLSEDEKKQQEETHSQIFSYYRNKFGEYDFENKIRRVTLLGSKRFSIISYHNNYLDEIRNAYILGSFYPALVSACAFGERLLNHMVFSLIEYHTSSDSYKRLYRKRSVDDWSKLINALIEWKILLPGVADLFEQLKDLRHKSIHFNLEREELIQEDSLKAVKLVQSVINRQFSSMNDNPWFLIFEGECYIRKDYENIPFVRQFVLPAFLKVSPFHKIKNMDPNTGTTTIEDIHPSSLATDGEITDEQFIELRRKFFNKRHSG